LHLFKEWAEDPKNLTILPGYCVSGTVGNKVLARQKIIRVDKHTTIEVKCQIENLSFSAHTDRKGILQLIRHVQPRNVVLVHGEREGMVELKKIIEHEFSVPCFHPPNGVSISIHATDDVRLHLSARLVQEGRKRRRREDEEQSMSDLQVTSAVDVDGVLVCKQNPRSRELDIRLMHQDEALHHMGLSRHTVILESDKTYPLPPLCSDGTEEGLARWCLSSLRDR